VTGAGSRASVAGQGDIRRDAAGDSDACRAGRDFHDWATITTDTPVTNTWTFTNDTATATVTQRFYRAFITP
jgi:hypothetical protein